MNKELLIKDLQETLDVIAMNKDLIKENYFFDILSMFRKLVKDIKGGKYE